MAICALTRQQFDQVRAERPALALLTDNAGEWFGDDTSLVLGAIAYRPLDLSWSFVVVIMDHPGQCLTADRESGFRDHAEARRQLLEHMALALTHRHSAPNDPHERNSGSPMRAVICLACHRLAKNSAVLLRDYHAALDALAATSRFDRAHTERSRALARVSARLYEAQRFEQHHHDSHGLLEPAS